MGVFMLICQFVQEKRNVEAHSVVRIKVAVSSNFSNFLQSVPECAYVNVQSCRCIFQLIVHKTADQRIPEISSKTLVVFGERRDDFFKENLRVAACYAAGNEP